MKKITFIITLVIISKIAFTQLSGKLGKIDIEELQNSICKLDSTADAEIISDIGTSYFKYHDNIGMKMYFERHFKIKIYTKNGFEHSDIEIPLYQGENGKEEKIEQLKACTYNLEEGKIVKQKLKQSDIYDIRKNSFYSSKKFSMPMVKEGSIIEVKYIISSDYFYELRDWQFQSSIPTRWSEYIVSVPEFYKYNISSKGSHPLLINETKREADYLIIQNKTRRRVRLRVVTEFEDHTIEFTSDKHRWAAENVPALKKEPYMLAINNYLTMMEFELSWIQFPYEERISYSRTWESIKTKLSEHKRFGKRLKQPTLFLKDELNLILQGDTSKLQITNKLFEYVKSNFDWNKEYGIFTTKSLRETHTYKTGNVADINLYLISILRFAGLDANPVLLSTRDYRKINPAHPSINQMNYVIVHVRLPKHNILLDATEAQIPFNSIPFRCLNGKGRLISENKNKWIQLNKNSLYNLFASCNIKISEDGDYIVNINKTYSDYAAMDLREDDDSKIITRLKNELLEKYESTEIDSIYLTDYSSINKPLKQTINFRNNNDRDGILYINPVIVDRVVNNPFKSDSRIFPINYGYKYKKVYSYSYVIPPNYKIDEIPENISLTTSDKSFLYMYQIKQIGNSLRINIIYKTNKVEFAPEYYIELKEMYNRIIKKESEKVVLIPNA